LVIGICTRQLLKGKVLGLCIGAALFHAASHKKGSEHITGENVMHMTMVKP
jgi:hypothetical protein